MVPVGHIFGPSSQRYDGHIRPILWRPLIGVAYWPWHVVFLGQCHTRAAYAPCVISREPLGKWPAGARPLGGVRNCTSVGAAGGPIRLRSAVGLDVADFQRIELVDSHGSSRFEQLV